MQITFVKRNNANQIVAVINGNFTLETFVAGKVQSHATLYNTSIIE